MAWLNVERDGLSDLEFWPSVCLHAEYIAFNYPRLRTGQNKLKPDELKPESNPIMSRQEVVFQIIVSKLRVDKF